MDETEVKDFDLALFKRLLRLLKPFTLFTLLALLLLCVGKLLDNATPRVMQYAIDGPIAKNDLAGLLMPVLLFLLLKTVSFFAMYGQQILTTRIGQSIIREKRLELFSHIQGLSHRFFSRNPVGRLMSRTVHDTDVINELFSSGLITVFGDLFTILFIVIFMFSLDAKLALLSLTILPPVMALSWFFKVRIRDLFRKVRLKTADINTRLQESITGMRVIQLFNQEKNDAARFDQHNREYLEVFKKIVNIFAFFFPVMNFLSALALALILWYSGFKYLGHGITIGILVAFVEYIQDLFHPIRDLAEKYNILQNAMASSERIFHLLDEKDRIPEPENPRPPVAFKGKIEFRNVSFAYHPDKPVLKNISFTVEPGETVALLGSTGSGKTTCINLLNRFYLPQEGTIRIDGVPITEIPAPYLRKLMSTVSQDLFAFSDTILENIRLGNPEITRQKVKEAAQLIHADGFIQALPKGYDEVLRERGNNLSTGQKQLLAFARVLAWNPRILILDEATSSIDPGTEALIQEATRKVTKARTSLIIAHRLATIREADKILVLHHGELEEEGTHETLLKNNGIYSRLHRIQFA